MMNPLQKIRTSFSKQLSLWVAGFVLATSGVVIFLLVSFSEGDRQYSLAAVCPAEDIYGKYSHMHHVLLGWGIGGVLVANSHD